MCSGKMHSQVVNALFSSYLCLCLSDSQFFTSLNLSAVEWEVSNIDKSIWTFGPKLMMPFGELWNLYESEVSWRKYWWALSFLNLSWFLFAASALCSWLKMWRRLSSLPQRYAAMLPLQLWGTHTQKSPFWSRFPLL